MPRYFEVDELKEWVQNWFEKNRYYHPYSKSNDIPIPELYDILERMPTADVVDKERYVRVRENADILSDALSEYQSADMVEVVRCKDCVHHKNAPKTTDVWCERIDGLLPKDWFCADGERREDVEETD